MFITGFILGENSYARNLKYSIYVIQFYNQLFENAGENYDFCASNNSDFKHKKFL
jgi:hypothetical protein